MGKQVSIKKNFIMNVILTLSGIIFPIISFSYVSDILGPAGTGQVDFATSVIHYFAIFAMLGIPTYGVKACAKVRDDKEKLSRTVHELLTINLVMSVIIYLLLIPTILFVPRIRDEKTLFIVISSTIILNSIGMEYLYKGLEQYSYITIRSVIFKAIACIAMFLLVKDESDYIMYGAITILAASASHVLNFINSRKLIYTKWIGNYDYKQHFKPVGIFLAMACATTIYLNLDRVMLGFMTTETDVGYYGASIKIKTILVALVTSLGNVLLPRVSYYVDNKQFDEFKRVTEKALNFVWIASTPLMLYFIIFAKEGLMFLSGNKYIPAIPAMMITMPTLVFIGLTNILGIQVLVPLGKEKYVLYSEIWGAVVDLILNIILIPGLKSTGAAIGTTVAEIVVLVVQVYYLTKFKNEISILKVFKKISYWKIIIAMAVGTALSVWVKFIDVPWFKENVRVHNFILLAISAIPFFCAYAVVLIVLKDKMMLEILGSFTKKLKKKSTAKA